MLLTLAIAIWAGWLTAKLALDTLLGRACQERLVDLPAAWLGSLSLRKAVSLLVTGTVLTVAVAYLAPIISAEAALVLAGDALAYVEVLTAVMLVAIRSGRASTMVRQKVGAAARRALITCRGLTRGRTPRHPRKPSRLLAPLDDPEPAFVVA